MNRNLSKLAPKKKEGMLMTRRIVLCASVVLLTFIGLTANAQSPCVYKCCGPTPTNPGCVTGTCGTTVDDPGYRCQKPANEGACSCVPGSTFFLWKIFSCGSAATFGMSMGRVAYGSGPDFFAPGARYSAMLSSASDHSINNFDEAGDVQGEQIPPVRSAGIVLEFQANSDPNLRTIRVLSFTARIPTFAHSHITPALTGQNVFELAAGYSGGQVNIATGEFFVEIRANLSNSYYSEANPRFVYLRVTGTIDSVNSQLTASVDGIGARES